MLLIECITEFIGAFLLCAVGVWTKNAFFAGGIVFICSFIAFKTNLSKGSFNPAITFATALVKKQHWTDVPFYLLSQFIGSVAVWVIYMKYY